MILKKIDEKSYEEFVIRSGQGSMYQSIEWLNLKKLEGKKCELLGLFSNDKLVGVSLIIYSRVLKKYYFEIYTIALFSLFKTLHTCFNMSYYIFDFIIKTDLTVFNSPFFKILSQNSI